VKANRQRIEQIKNSIRDILVSDWDPIGAMDDGDWPCDEYDSYIGPIYHLLTNGESTESIARYLCFVESELMGFGQLPISERLAVAEKLRRLDVDAEPS
jgi:hypothetical protein